MDTTQITLAVLLAVIFIPVPLVILAVWLCCRRDICHLRNQPLTMRRPYLPMSSTTTNMDEGSPETGIDDGGDGTEPEPVSNFASSEQKFVSPPAPQFE